MSIIVDLTEVVNVAKSNERSNTVVAHIEIEGKHYALVSFLQLAYLKGDLK